MRIYVLSLQTPARRLKDNTSTGHAASPASIVVGKAYLRSTQLLGAAPKVVCNSALLERDMKMDEDLTGALILFLIECSTNIHFPSMMGSKSLKSWLVCRGIRYLQNSS